MRDGSKQRSCAPRSRFCRSPHALPGWGDQRSVGSATPDASASSLVVRDRLEQQTLVVDDAIGARLIEYNAGAPRSTSGYGMINNGATCTSSAPSGTTLARVPAPLANRRGRSGGGRQRGMRGVRAQRAEISFVTDAYYDLIRQMEIPASRTYPTPRRTTARTATAPRPRLGQPIPARYTPLSTRCSPRRTSTRSRSARSCRTPTRAAISGSSFATAARPRCGSRTSASPTTTRTCSSGSFRPRRSRRAGTCVYLSGGTDARRHPRPSSSAQDAYLVLSDLQGNCTTARVAARRRGRCDRARRGRPGRPRRLRLRPRTARIFTSLRSCPWISDPVQYQRGVARQQLSA